MRSQIKQSLFLLMVGFSGIVMLPVPGYCRFIETDERLVDQEERYNTETYNDKYSYRFPVGWYRLFDQSDAAVRIHAGSLNISRFDYSEEIKFRVENAVAGFSYLQQRHEDVLEQSTVREVRVDGFLPGALYMSMVADGGSFKEYGDVGWALGIGEVRRPLFEVLYWSVDHFYDTKKSDETDERRRQTWSLAVKSTIDLTQALSLHLQAEYDHPLVWLRPSLGYTYEYEKRSASGGVTYSLSDEQRLQMDLSWTKKHEGKTWNNVAYQKSFEREVRISELKWIEEGLTEQAVGVGYIDRKVDYVHAGAALDDTAPLPEERSPDNSKRDELTAFATRYQPLRDDRHYMQYGLFCNYVNLDETRHESVMESKTQWAWEYRYSKKARVLLNTTWDINQLTDDFPYDKRPFRPWGGGDIQFIAAF